jgi:hypothetical protein
VAEQQEDLAVDADAASDEGSAAAASPSGPRPSTAVVRARLIDGDTAGARVMFDHLTASLEASPELLLTEATLLEAEGRLEEALVCLGRIVATTPGSARIAGLSHVRIARLATELRREDLAEISGMAALAQDPDDIDGLRAVAFAQQRHTDTEAWLCTMRRLAGAPGAEEADVWTAVEAFSELGRWAEVLELIEQHEFELDPWRMTPLRLRALIEQGWQRRALEHLGKAYADEYIPAHEAVAVLVQGGALALAAKFITGAMSRDPWQAEARKSLMAIAVRTTAAASLPEAPFQFADAIQARDILMPGHEPVESAVARSLLVLTRDAGKLLASGDPVAATRLLVAAVRLAPSDRALLESLADAAHRANQTERYLDTLLRIWAAHRDASVLLAAARGVLETSSWATISRVMSIAAAEEGFLGLDIGVVVETFREQACRKLDDYIRGGDVAAGLELVIALSQQWSVECPDDLVSRLLRATKRRLRSQRVGGEALIATVGPLYLELAPGDVDVCRMMARVRVRQRRLAEARELLCRVIAISPHVAGDWVALAVVQHELGELEARDVSIARALVIAPDDELPPALSTVREQVGLA